MHQLWDTLAVLQSCGLYQQFLAGSQEAFKAEEYDVAYHALMAAIHCAQALKDVHSLGEVERVACEQLAVIDKQHPEYAHSTHSAAKRGHVSIFAALAQQARTRIKLVQIETHEHPAENPLPNSER